MNTHLEHSVFHRDKRERIAVRLRVHRTPETVQPRTFGSQATSGQLCGNRNQQGLEAHDSLGAGRTNRRKEKQMGSDALGS